MNDEAYRKAVEKELFDRKKADAGRQPSRAVKPIVIAEYEQMQKVV